MGKKKTKNKFIEQSIAVHGDKYNYSNVSYMGDGIKVAIICHIHGTFFQTPSSHLQGSGCKECGKNKISRALKKSTKTFIQQAMVTHNNFYGYTNTVYKGSATKVTITCPEHGFFKQTPFKHLEGQGCKQCSMERNRLSHDKFIEEIRLIHNNKYDYSKTIYTKMRNAITIICPEHGEFTQIAQEHKRGAGCIKCGKKSHKKSMKLPLEHFLKRFKKVHGNKYDYSQINRINSNEKISIICPEHGEFKQRTCSHYTSGCPKCYKSGISNAETEWLNECGLMDDAKHRQVTISINNTWLFVDGFEPLTNTIYEYHGDFWHGNPKIYNQNDINPVNKKTYGELYEATKVREKLITSNGYNLITKWESDE